VGLFNKIGLLLLFTAFTIPMKDESHNVSNLRDSSFVGMTINKQIWLSIIAVNNRVVGHPRATEAKKKTELKSIKSEKNLHRRFKAKQKNMKTKLTKT
jgi:cell shape-determining protein MreC